MKKLGCVLILLTLCMGCAQASQKELVVDPNEDRIISTTVSVTEILGALEVDLVGVPSSYKDLPKRYEGLDAVGNPMSPDMELIMSLKPTDVMSVTTLKYDLESVFENAGINTRYVNLESLDNMYEEVASLGKTYDKTEQADKIIAEYEETVKEILTRITGKKSPKVLILMGVPGSYLVATEHSYIGDLVKKIGGTNIISNETKEYLASNTEYLQTENPDIILRAAHGMPEEVVEMFDEEFKDNDIWKHFDAVKNDRVYDLEELLFGTTGNLQAAEALDELYKMLYDKK